MLRMIVFALLCAGVSHAKGDSARTRFLIVEFLLFAKIPYFLEMSPYFLETILTFFSTNSHLLTVFSPTNSIFLLTSLVTYMEAGSSITYQSEKPFGQFEPDLQIYCFQGSAESLATMFQTLRFRLHIDSDDFSQFVGHSPAEVRELYENQRTIFSFSMMNTGKRTQIKIDPFNQTCLGIESPHKYELQLHAVRLDLEQLLMLAIGLTLFCYAKTFSQTPLFYYLTGIALGIFASLLVAVYFISKLFPKVSKSV